MLTQEQSSSASVATLAEEVASGGMTLASLARRRGVVQVGQPLVLVPPELG